MIDGTLEHPTEVVPQNLLTPEEAARILNVTAKCLANWRLRGTNGPRFVRLSATRVRYRRDDLEAWIQDRLRMSTSDTGSSIDGGKGLKEEHHA